MKKLYYVEDDSVIASAVRDYLMNKDFELALFKTVEQVKKAMEIELPILILIDWNLPDGSGYQLCTWIKQRWNQLPIIFLTVKNDAQDIVLAFGAGADDYLTKPFELEVLHARIKAILKRTGNKAIEYITCGDISIDKARLKVNRAGEEIVLSNIEYQILKLLLENKGCILTRSRLLEVIWDKNGNFVNDNTLTVTMKRLREKLNNPPYLKTIRSFGYRMEEL